MSDPTCDIPECPNPVYRRRWCNRHYLRWKRHGDPLAGGRAVREDCAALPGEEWRAIAGYEGLYEVSNLGRVCSLPRLDMRGHRLPGRLMQPSEPPLQTHYRLRLYRDGRGSTKLVHKLVAEAFIGPCPRGMEVRHGDGNYLNNRASNLSYASHSINMFDRRRHGTDHEANKTHCKHGHKFTPANTYINTVSGARQCRACARERRRAA